MSISDTHKRKRKLEISKDWKEEEQYILDISIRFGNGVKRYNLHAIAKLTLIKIFIQNITKDINEATVREARFTLALEH